MTSHVQLFRLQMALCSVTETSCGVPASVSLPPSVPSKWGPVTRSQVHNLPSGLRRTPHVPMAPLMRDPELRMVTWHFMSFFSCQCEFVHLRLESAYWK